MSLAALTRWLSPSISARPPANTSPLQVLTPSFTVNLNREPTFFLPRDCLIGSQFYKRASGKEDICLASSRFVAVALES